MDKNKKNKNIDAELTEKQLLKAKICMIAGIADSYYRDDFTPNPRMANIRDRLRELANSII